MRLGEAGREGPGGGGGDSGREAQVVGMAVAGWTETGREWRECTLSLLHTIQEPYLAAVLHFLLGSLQTSTLGGGESGGWGLSDLSKREEGVKWGLLGLESLPIFDRVALATLHLNDAAFVHWLRCGVT